MTRTRRSNARSATQLVLAVCMGIGLGAATVLALQPTPTPSELLAGGAPSYAVISVEPFADSRPVTVSFTTSAPQQLTVPASGVVTRSACANGVTFDSGTSPLEISGEEILALTLVVPPYRDLEYGDRGADVTAVQSELVRLGYAAGDSGMWDGSTESALGALRKSLGIDSRDGGLSLSRLMWLPSPHSSVAACLVSVGRQVQEGAALAELRPSVTTLHVVPLPTDLAAGARTLVVGAATVPVDSNGVVSNPDAISALIDAPGAATAIASLGSATPTPLQAELRLAEPLHAAIVPGSSVRVFGVGACVFDADTDAPYQVTVISSSLGNATITFAGERAPDRVHSEPDSALTCM